MDYFSAILPVATLVIGWSLNEFSQQVKIKREHRAALGRALADMLEIRHQTLTAERIIRIISKELQWPSEAMPAIRTLIDHLFIKNDELSKRYDEAINLVAEADPITAFGFRSKNIIPDLLRQWRSFASQHSVPPEEIEKVEVSLRDLIAPYLDEVVKELAELHSRNSKEKVDELLNKEFELPEEFKNLLEKMKDEYSIEQTGSKCT